METFRRAVRCLADPRCLFFARVSQEKNGRSEKKGLKNKFARRSVPGSRGQAVTEPLFFCSRLSRYLGGALPGYRLTAYPLLRGTDPARCGFSVW